MSACVELSSAEQYGLCKKKKKKSIRLYKADMSWLDLIDPVLALTNAQTRALKTHDHKLVSSGIALKCSCAFTSKTSFPYGVR